MQCIRFIGKANAGIGDRLHTVTINDGEEHGPETIRGGIDGFLITKFVEVIRLTWPEQSNIGFARTVQGDVVMIGEMAQELPLWQG